MFGVPWKSIHWPNFAFLFGTLILTLTAVPYYLWQFGLTWFQAGLFFLFFVMTGLSITLGYHRLFSHRAFQAAWPVRFFTLVFGAAAFENSVLCWASDHRMHHKHVDHEEDPYDISKGFLYAHIGWIFLKTQPQEPLQIAQDLQQDRLVMWQHRYYHWIAIFAGLVLPALLGLLWGGWKEALGCFLIAGVARLVIVQHFTFLINSMCHSIGKQPYSNRSTARDSALMAFLTFGEGYHNFHHTFQYDYRNGVKAWHFDPTKWCIWLLHKMGLAWRLKRVSTEKILLAQIAEQQRNLADKLQSRTVQLSEPIRSRLQNAQQRLQEAYRRWEELETEYRRALELKLEASREKVLELRRNFKEARRHFREAMREWQETHRLALAQFA